MVDEQHRNRQPVIFDMLCAATLPGDVLQVAMWPAKAQSSGLCRSQMDSDWILSCACCLAGLCTKKRLLLCTAEHTRPLLQLQRLRSGLLQSMLQIRQSQKEGCKVTSWDLIETSPDSQGPQILLILIEPYLSWSCRDGGLLALCSNPRLLCNGQMNQADADAKQNHDRRVHVLLGAQFWNARLPARSGWTDSKSWF